MSAKLWSALVLTPLSNSLIDQGIGKRRQDQGAPKASADFRCLNLMPLSSSDLVLALCASRGAPGRYRSLYRTDLAGRQVATAPCTVPISRGARSLPLPVPYRSRGAPSRYRSLYRTK